MFRLIALPFGQHFRHSGSIANAELPAAIGTWIDRRDQKPVTGPVSKGLRGFSA
jgi:hypothetical protein